MRARLQPIPVLTLVAALGLGAGCRRETEAVDVSGGRVGVTVAAARIDTLRDLATASGTVVPATAADWTVISTEVAEIADLPKKANDVVASGDVLVRLDIPSMTQELSALELGVLDAAGRADRAKTELTRQTSLVERGLTSRNTYDAARLEQSAADTNLVAARTRLESVKATGDRSVIRARFSGVVTEVFRAVGDQVRPTPEDAILRVIDPARVQVSVQLPFAQLARVVPGQTATVQAIAGVAKEAATVVAKSDSAGAGAPTGELRLAFVGPATLVVDTPVSVEVLLDQRTGALVIPLAAVQRDDLGVWVMTAGDDGLAHRRDVRVGLVTRELAQVVAGLQAGENVVTSGVADIAEGTPIVIAR